MKNNQRCCRNSQSPNVIQEGNVEGKTQAELLIEGWIQELYNGGRLEKTWALIGNG